MTVTLHVCIACRSSQTLEEGETTPGARLYAAILDAHAAILDADVPDDVNVITVEHLSACVVPAARAVVGRQGASYAHGRPIPAGSPG